MKQMPFAPDGLCCPVGRHYYGPLRLPLGSPPLPGSAGYGRATLPGRKPGAEDPPQLPGQPSDHSTPLTPGGSSASAPGSRTPSIAFAVQAQAWALQVPETSSVLFRPRVGAVVSPCQSTVMVGASLGDCRVGPAGVRTARCCVLHQGASRSYALPRMREHPCHHEGRGGRGAVRRGHRGGCGGGGPVLGEGPSEYHGAAQHLPHHGSRNHARSRRPGVGGRPVRTRRAE
jgi:hypothetical protein